MKTALLALSLLLCTAAGAPDVTGEWVTQDKSGLVTISRCGDSVCGKITKALIEKPNYPKNDIHNPDPKLRSRPILGMTFLSGFKGAGGEWTDGRIYDPESGKTYKSRLRLNGDGSLKVSGCVLVFCQSQRWTRPR